MRVLRVYHAGRDAAHRLRERALVEAGVEVVLVVPRAWPESGAERTLSDEAFRVVELDVRRPGDVNRHTHADDAAVRALLDEVRPDVLDLHEEPVAAVTRQWLRAAPATLPVVLYTAQNIDKRFPPPFVAYEHAAYDRVQALYPCSRQAASVARGKGFGGRVGVLPLGFDPVVVTPGTQAADDEVLVLGLVGRLVPEKGVRDAVRVLAGVRRQRAARLLLVGEGPEREPALALARELGVADAVEVLPWVDHVDLAALYRRMHVLLVPSTATRTWVEQFGRVIVEAQASGAVVAGYASGAIPEVVGAAGVCVPEGDVDGLTAAVTGLDLPTLRDAGLDLAATRTWAEVARRQAALYAASLTPPDSMANPVATGRAAAVHEFGTPALEGRRPSAVVGAVLDRLSRR